jgi:glutathione synthase/RimK-type ligase-like ATP-grasp enzyme
MAWEWEYDKDFVNFITSECQDDSLTFFQVHPKNFDEVSQMIDRKMLAFRIYLDRAGDVHESFAHLAEKIRSRGTWIINHAKDVERSRDKATMHLEFLTKGLHVPFTVILSPYDKDKDPELRVSELERLGRPFIVKPACGGGGLGVVMGAENLMDVIEARKEFRHDKYLLQSKIIPKYLGNRRAWFRSFYVCGKVISCWWDDQTHLYDAITCEEVEKYRLHKLKEITKAISEVSRLNFFSTEIAIDRVDDKFTVVDYVNEPCDMRIKSVHPDGIPNEVVLEIVQALLNGVKREIKQRKRK